MKRGDDGKMKIQPKQSLTGKDGWIPICEKNLPFEATTSFLLTPDAPGVPRPIKLQEQHRPLFPLDRPITEESGRRIAEWASGGKAERTVSAPPAAPADAAPIATEGEGFIDADQVAFLETMCQDAGIPVARLKGAAKVERLAQILAGDYQRAKDWIAKHTTQAA